MQSTLLTFFIELVMHITEIENFSKNGKQRGHLNWQVYSCYQLNPQVTQDRVICDEGQEAGGENHYSALKGFFKAEPKALGVMHWMIN